MRIQQNSDAQYNPLQNQDNISKLSGAGKSGQKSGNAFSVPLAGQKGENLIQQRQDLARKQALKVVADAFDGEKKFDAQMQSIKDEINNLQSCRMNTVSTPTPIRIFPKKKWQGLRNIRSV